MGGLPMTTRSYYDDNFGFYEIESEDDVAFYHEMERNSVRKRCRGCDRMVKIKSDYAYCNSRAEKLERGGARAPMCGMGIGKRERGVDYDDDEGRRCDLFPLLGRVAGKRCDQYVWLFSVLDRNVRP